MIRRALALAAACCCLVVESSGREAPAAEMVQLAAGDARAAVEEAARIVESNYILFDRRGDIASALRARVQAGAYDNVADWRRLAVRLSADLVSVSGDGHFGVTYDPATIASWSAPEADSDGDALAAHNAQLAAQWRARGQGLRSVELLPGNIGYIRLDYVAPTSDAARAQWNSALARVHGADALILDLRVNRGGSPEGVSTLLGAFTGPAAIPYATIEAWDGSATQMATRPADESVVFQDRPMFVLTSRYTASAGEAIAYHLRALGRATIVGERTAGGAHPTDLLSINEHLILRIPRERTISAVTGENWEGAGVVPDVAASFDLAYPRAQLLALEASASVSDTTYAEAREWLRTVADGALEPWMPDRNALAPYAGSYPGVGTILVRDSALWLLDGVTEAPLEPVSANIFRNSQRDELLYAFDTSAGAGTVTVAYSDGRVFLFEREAPAPQR